MSNNLPAPDGLPDFSPTPQRERPASAGGGLERYIFALLRGKWIILLVTGCAAGAGVMATRLLIPQYMAQATLWVEASGGGGGGGSAQAGPLRSADLAVPANAWTDLLRSATVLDYVVRAERLYIEPSSVAQAPMMASFQPLKNLVPGRYRLSVSEDGAEFVLATPEGAELERGRAGGPIGASLGFRWSPRPHELPVGRTVEFSVSTPGSVARHLLSTLEPRPTKRDGMFIHMTLRGTDPERTAAALNAIANRTAAVTAQIKRANYDEVTSVLREQLEIAEQRLRDAEMELETYRVQTITLPSEQAGPVAPGLAQTQGPVFQQFFAVKLEREQLKQDREAVERILEQAQKAELSIDALNTVASTQSSPPLTQSLQELTLKRGELRGLQLRYTEEHPSIHKLQAEIPNLERKVIPALAQGLISQLMHREAELEGRIETASDEMRQIPPRSIEEARLQRSVAIADELHTMLKQRYESARLSAVSTVPDLRLLDPAVVPTRPVEDKRMQVILMALVGGLGLSVGGILVREQLDRRVRYPNQVTGNLRLMVLGAVPHMSSDPKRIDAKSAARLSEAFRELRLGVSHSCEMSDPLLLTVTSPEPGDGKSFVAANLALSFAHQGFRTLLIDGDLRRGRLHDLMHVSRSPGLTDFLVGAASYSEVVRSSMDSPAKFICAGNRRSGAPELLGSAAMSRLITELHSEFEVIIIDSPPLGAGVDPYVLATVTGNVLLVLRAESTNLAVTEAKLGLLDRLPVHLAGAVLNDVKLDEPAYRYYLYHSEYALDEDREILVEPGGRIRRIPSASEPVQAST